MLLDRRSSSRFAFASLVALALSGGAANAAGQTPQQVAEGHLKAGLKLYDQASFEAARIEFLQAQAVYPRPSLLRNLALCELKTNRPLEAMQHLRAYLADPSTTGDKRENGKKNLDDAFAKTGHLLIKATDGVSVSLDGQSQLGTTPFKEPIDTLPGHHFLEARFGDRTTTREIDAVAGVVADVELRFEDRPASPAIIPTNPSGKPGSYDAVSPPAEPAPSFWTTRRTVGVVAGGLAVVATGVGIGFLGARNGHVNDGKDALGTSAQPCAQPASPACVQYDGARDGIASTERGAAISFVAAGALAVTSALLILWPESKRSASLRILPIGRDFMAVGTF